MQDILNEIQLLRRDLLGHLLINFQVCVEHFAGDPPEPLVERNIQELVSSEQLQHHQVGITGVFEIVRCVGGNVPDIIGAESIVRALSPGKNTVMRPLPEIQYCHSEAFGCQCISRMCPGLMMSRPAATCLETGKFRESTMRTSPASLVAVGVIDLMRKVYCCFAATCSPPMSALSGASELGRLAGKI